MNEADQIEAVGAAARSRIDALREAYRRRTSAQNGSARAGDESPDEESRRDESDADSHRAGPSASACR
ncbi:hypothetical protein [Gordonia jinhuaensis]|uniref:hypothetical protein n=1 Tax=Gordonia jinhuaensis TaxID=1517702 RepID=UPI0016638694|nr:hypothetical protein [Gordonia jinhuaensis]